MTVKDLLIMALQEIAIYEENNKKILINSIENILIQLEKEEIEWKQ